MRKRTAIVLAFVAAGLFVSGCAGPDTTKTTTETGRPLADRLSGEPGIENFACVNPSLYRGAQPTSEGYRRLRELGVKTVISFRSAHSSKAEVEACGMTCIEIPLQANILGSVPPTDEEVRRFFDIVLDPERQPVFIHCMAGRDRTGTMTALYRIEVDGWSPEEAAEEMRLFGFHTSFINLERFVAGYRSRGFGFAR
jgi:tyrosine-protein phosphatase SIW14